MHLNPQLRQEYLDKHLPYRINSMLSPDLMAHRLKSNFSNELKVKCYQDSLVVEPAFEISVIFGRSLLNFLGITYDSKANKLARHQPKGDDVSLVDIYPNGSFCPLDEELLVQNHDSLSTIIKVANKSVAHLTSSVSTQDELLQLETARQTIYKLILKYVPDINKTGQVNKVGIWWYEQVVTVDLSGVGVFVIPSSFNKHT